MEAPNPGGSYVQLFQVPLTGIDGEIQITPSHMRKRDVLTRSILPVGTNLCVSSLVMFSLSPGR